MYSWNRYSKNRNILVVAPVESELSVVRVPRLLWEIDMFMMRLANINFMWWHALEFFWRALKSLSSVEKTLLLKSLQGTRTTLNSDSTGAITSKSILKYLYYDYILPYATFSERGFSPVTTATSGLSETFSVAFHDIKFVFGSFLMIISICQSQRGGRTTLRSDSTGGYESKW